MPVCLCPRPSVQAATSCRAARPWTVAPPAEAQPRGEWWLGFQDPALAELVQRAGSANTSIQQAAGRPGRGPLAAALGRRRALGAGGRIGRGHPPGRCRHHGQRHPATLGTAGLNVSYELDLFGKLSQTSDAARLDADARAALLQSTRLMVQADVAQTYLQLRAAQTELQLVNESLAAYQDTLRLTQRRQQAGDVAELDVARVQTEVAATESEALALQRQQALLTNALAGAGGRGARQLCLARCCGRCGLPVIPPGVPGTVLARRPDVSAAQTAVMAAQARLGWRKRRGSRPSRSQAMRATHRPSWATSSSGRPAPGA